MASYQQVNYCRTCKTNVGLDNKNHCKRCGGSQISKTWSVRFRFIDENLKEVHKRLSGYSTKKEATEDYIKFVALNKKYEKPEDAVAYLTLDKLYNEYLNYIKPQIKESTYKAFKSMYEQHLQSTFGDMLIKDITPKDILDWQVEKSNYSYRYRVKLKEQLSRLLGYAELYYHITNQVRFVLPIKQKHEKKEMQIWTLDEFAKFIASVDVYQYKVFYYTLFLTGARLGEILALTWEDCDFKKGLLNINKSVSNKIAGRLTSPKNLSSYRKVSMTPQLIKILKDYKSSVKPNTEKDFIFTLRESSLRRHKDAACDLAGVKNIRLHDFRHSHASYLLSNGISVVAIAKRLGHKDIEQTLNTYSHLLGNEDDSLLKVLENLGTNLGTL